MNTSNKPTIFSGIQPSGNLHLGNYLGAISQWVEMQNDYHCVFCIVDYHAITVRQNPQELAQRIKDVAKIYVASGIDPRQTIIFQQSRVSEHTELGWLLNCTSARMSDMYNMTQFKDKSAKGVDNVSVGLFDYPVLMAADILLYNTDFVPVGEDQVQHVELCRDLAKRFNHDFGQNFKVPQVKIRTDGARIMGLDDPTKKMSKSATSEWNYIALNDSPEKASKKIMRAVTDSDSCVRYNKEQKPAISNLLTIYSLLTNKKISQIEEDYQGSNYGPFKKDLAEVVVNFLQNFQSAYNNVSDDMIIDIMNDGANRAKEIAQETMLKTKNIIGVG